MGDKTGPSIILRCLEGQLLADQVCRDARNWVNEPGSAPRANSISN